jgi:2-hydroxy-4-carboxymuconate semialdehyde hemiacetal dehydrogenase
MKRSPDANHWTARASSALLYVPASGAERAATIEYMREAGPENIENGDMAHHARRLNDKVEEVGRFYAVPASNTAFGHIMLENRSGGVRRGHRTRIDMRVECTMKVCVAGEGAFGQKHMDALKRISGVEVTCLVGGDQEATAQVARKYAIAHHTGDLGEGIERADAVILTTPTPLHRAQAEQVMRGGRHVLIEIPIADSVEDSEVLLQIQRETGVVAMAGHVRRFNPSHQWVHKRIQKGELKIQQLDVQTYFFRRSNMNAAGQPRSWTDHLLWHHAAHTVDLFQYQSGELVIDCYAVQGSINPILGIAMDLGILLKSASGAILTLSLSFNNDGPIGSFFRYICDNGTYWAYYDDLVDGNSTPIDLSGVDVSMDGVELEDREFIGAITERREPNSSLAQVLPCMRTLGRLEKIIDPERRAVA